MDIVWKFEEAKCKVNVNQEVLQAAILAAKKHSPREIGGTIVGSISLDNFSASIAKLILPKSKIRSGLSWFFRPSDTEDRQLQKLYDDSEGQILYLGEWHSHPNGAPVPSSTDLNSMKELATSDKVASDTPFLLLIGGELKEDPQTDIYLFRKDGSFEKGVLESS